MRYHSNTAAMLAELEEAYPERLPGIEETPASYQRYAGSREVVILLRRLATQATDPQPQIVRPSRRHRNVPC